MRLLLKRFAFDSKTRGPGSSHRKMGGITKSASVVSRIYEYMLRIARLHGESTNRVWKNTTAILMSFGNYRL